MLTHPSLGGKANTDGKSAGVTVTSWRGQGRINQPLPGALLGQLLNRQWWKELGGQERKGSGGPSHFPAFASEILLF